MTNEHLMVFVAAMNAAKVLPNKCGLFKSTETGVRRWHYTKELSAHNFIVDDNSTDSKKFLKNTQRDMSGRNAKYFLTAIWEVLREMAFEDSSEWEIPYNEDCIMIGPFSGSMSVERMQTIAESFVQSSLIVAECAGTKNTILLNKPTSAIELSRKDQIDMWVQDAIENCHDQFKSMFTEGKEEPYPNLTWHRLDYALEISPMNFSWAFLSLLDEAAQVSRLALRQKKTELHAFYENLSNNLSDAGLRKY